jgi:hypothetical protein
MVKNYPAGDRMIAGLLAHATGCAAETRRSGFSPTRRYGTPTEVGAAKAHKDLADCSTASLTRGMRTAVPALLSIWVAGCSSPPTAPTVPTVPTASVPTRGSGTSEVATSSPVAAIVPSASTRADPAITMSKPAEVEPEVASPGFLPIPAKRKQGFPGVAFTEVRGFAFDLEVRDRPVCRTPLDADGTLCATVARPGAPLSAEQSKKLLAILGDKKSYGDGSKCFLPHHGFVFYDARGVAVAEVSLCLMCDVGRASPAIPAARGGEFGLAEQATASLRALCRDLGLPKCDARRPDEFGTDP